MRRSCTFLFWGARTCALLIILLPVTLAVAQTVRPVIMEYQGSARGQVDYVNDSFQPLNVVLESRAFQVSEAGDISYAPLPASIHLKLSAMSFRIPPKQTYTVYYDAKADAMPAWFVLYADFSPVPDREKTGMTVHIRLPHTVYLLPPKAALQKSDLTIQIAEFHASEKKVVVEVANSGPNFGRVLSVDATGHRETANLNGFPVFPNSKRRVEMEWKADEPPEKLVLKLEKFSLQQTITASDR